MLSKDNKYKNIINGGKSHEKIRSILVFALALGICASMAACGSNSNDESSKTETSSATTTEATTEESTEEHLKTLLKPH